MCIAYYVYIYIYSQYIYIYTHIICILICAGCRNNAFQPAGFADACIIGPKITVNFVWYLGYDSSQQRPEKCMLPRKNGHDDFGSIPLWGWFWSLVLDGCEHGGYPSEFSLGEYADSPVDLGFSSLPNAHMVKLQGLYFHNFGDGHQSINSFSLPDLHTDLF